MSAFPRSTLGKNSQKSVEHTIIALLRALTISIEALAKICRFHVYLGVKGVIDLVHFNVEEWEFSTFAPLTLKVEGGVRDEGIPLVF